MKRLIVIGLLIAIASFCYAEIVDRIVAKVGSDIILMSELENHRLQMEQTGNLPQETSELDILNDMIESKLILQLALEKDYQVDEFRIRQMVNSQIEAQFQRFGSEAGFRNELRRAGMTLSQLREFYENTLKEQRLREMIIQNEISTKVYISDMELEEYYQDNLDEFPLRPEMTELGMIRIDIKPDEKTKKEVRNQINNIYDKIREGQDFATLAAELSDCPSSSAGGDLGFFGRGTMVADFEDAAFSLKAGEISNIVETPFGYHIIKMEEKDEDEIRVRHILKMLTPTEDDIVRTVSKAESIRQRLLEDESFSDIAEKYSDDPSAHEGGVIGEYKEDEYPELFRAYLDRIDIGQVTTPIREGESVFLLAKLRNVPERPFNFQEIRDELNDYLSMQKQVEQYEKWIQNLIDDSYVEVLLY